MTAVNEMAPSDAMFPLAEYVSRIEKTRSKMAEMKADVLLIDCVEHMVYLFGYAPPAAIYQAVLLPLDGAPVGVVRGLDASMFGEQSWVRDVVHFADHEDPIAVLSAEAKRRGWAGARIAIELDSHFLPAKRFMRLQAALPDVRFVDFSQVLWELRLIKSDREIAMMREVSRIADRGMVAAIEAAREGVSERECAAALYAEVIREGADSMRSALISAGARSDSLHGRLGNHVLRPGDVLHVESIPLYRGYGARLMRSSVIGEPPPDLARAAEIMLSTQEAQYAAMRPGSKASDVDAILRNGILEAGLRETYGNFTGYTLGFIGLPKTSDFTRAFLPGSDWFLEEGMVFHMYTYAAGIAFSDTVLITRSGSERLTTTERKLFVR